MSRSPSPNLLFTGGGVLVAELFGSTALPATEKPPASPVPRRTSLLPAQQDFLDDAPPNVIAEKTAQAQSRLEMLCEVNRRLHRTLVDKKCLAETLRDANSKMAARVKYRSVQGPARESQIEELVSKLQGEQSQQQTGTLQMSKKILMLEERIAALSSVNQELQEEHRTDRAVLSEQQVAIKQKTKMVKELTRQIEFLEGRVDMSLKMERSMSMSDTASVVDSSYGGADKRGSLDRSATLTSMKAASQAPLTIDDYRKLPGMNLSLLLGEKKRTSTST